MTLVNPGDSNDYGRPRPNQPHPHNTFTYTHTQRTGTHVQHTQTQHTYNNDRAHTVNASKAHNDWHKRKFFGFPFQHGPAKRGYYELPPPYFPPPISRPHDYPNVLITTGVSRTPQPKPVVDLNEGTSPKISVEVPVPEGGENVNNPEDLPESKSLRLSSAAEEKQIEEQVPVGVGNSQPAIATGETNLLSSLERQSKTDSFLSGTNKTRHEGLEVSKKPGTQMPLSGAGQELEKDPTPVRTEAPSSGNNGTGILNQQVQSNDSNLHSRSPERPTSTSRDVIATFKEATRTRTSSRPRKPKKLD